MTRKLTAISLLFIAFRFPCVIDAQDSSTPVNARAQQLAALAGSKEASASAALKQALSDDHWYIRGVAAGALGNRANQPEAASLLPLIQDKNWFVRDEAVAALSALGGSFDASDLVTLLASPDAYTRARAASALGALKKTDSARELIKALADDHEIVRRSAARALGAIKALTAVAPLIGLLKDEDVGVRKSAASALGRIGDTRAAVAIREAFATTTEEDWEYAAALYRLGDREQVERVASGLASEYADARLSTVQTLLEFADTRSLPSLLRFAKPLNLDGQPANTSSKAESLSVRVLLARGLASFDSEQARVGLLALLEDAGPEVRALASASLAKNIRDFQAVDS